MMETVMCPLHALLSDQNENNANHKGSHLWQNYKITLETKLINKLKFPSKYNIQIWIPLTWSRLTEVIHVCPLTIFRVEFIEINKTESNSLYGFTCSANTAACDRTQSGSITTVAALWHWIMVRKSVSWEHYNVTEDIRSNQSSSSPSGRWCQTWRNSPRRSWDIAFTTVLDRHMDANPKNTMYSAMPSHARRHKNPSVINSKPKVLNGFLLRTWVTAS